MVTFRQNDQPCEVDLKTKLVCPCTDVVKALNFLVFA